MALRGRGRSGILAAPAWRAQGAETYQLANMVTVSTEIVDHTDIIFCRKELRQLHALAWCCRFRYSPGAYVAQEATQPPVRRWAPIFEN